jgi:hypothetical protein
MDNISLFLAYMAIGHTYLRHDGNEVGDKYRFGISLPLAAS